MKKRVLIQSIVAVLLLLFFSFIFIVNTTKVIGYTIFYRTSFKDTCLNNTSDSSSTLNTEAILYFKFNDNSYYGETDQVVCDLSGHRNDGFVSGAIWNSSGGPFQDGAFEFNGNSQITVPNTLDLSPNNTGQLSVSFWLKPSTFNFVGGNDLSGRNAIHFLGKYSNDGNNREWYFRMYNATAVDGDNRPKRISFYVFNLAGGLGAGSYFQDNLTENEWIHIVGIVNGTYTFIYKNGVLRDSDPLSDYNIKMERGDADFNIGRYDSRYLSLIGSIDELRIYNKALNSSEIAELYALKPSPDKVTLSNNSLKPTTEKEATPNTNDIISGSTITKSFSVNSSINLANKLNTSKKMIVTGKGILEINRISGILFQKGLVLPILVLVFILIILWKFHSVSNKIKNK